MSRRRCELEQAIIRAMILGDRAWLNTLGEQNWEMEKSFNMPDEQIYNLNYYRDLCHEANKRWWVELGHSTGEKLILCVSELSEALEGHRKSLMDDKLPHRSMVEVELVDFLIRAFDLAGGKGWDLVSHSEAKPILGTSLDEISTQVPYLTTPLIFSDGLMIITGYLVDCFRYKDFREKQAANLAYAVHTALRLMLGMGLDIQGAFDEKMAYNRVREDHKPENRVKEGGKKVLMGSRFSRFGPKDPPLNPPIKKMLRRSTDLINHPSHYGGDTTYEAIKVIEAWGLNFSLGSALKYICRRGKKAEEIEDLKKARWYVDREIKRLEAEK